MKKVSPAKLCSRSWRMHSGEREDRGDIRHRFGVVKNTQYYWVVPKVKQGGAGTTCSDHGHSLFGPQTGAQWTPFLTIPNFLTRYDKTS